MPEHRLPRLPRQVYAPAGPVPVVRRKDLVNPDTGDACDGLWVPDERRIYIERRLGLASAHQTLRHEQFHAWVDDLRIQLPKEKLELLCDLYAMGRMGEDWERQRAS